VSDQGKIRWTKLAISDLEVLVRYLQRRDPEAAGRIGRAIFKKTEILQDQPEAGQAMPEIGPDWRRLVYRRWLIIYKRVDGGVVIGRVWPTSLPAPDLQTELPEEQERDS